jgi:hypothetical protein
MYLCIYVSYVMYICTDEITGNIAGVWDSETEEDLCDGGALLD